MHQLGVLPWDDAGGLSVTVALTSLQTVLLASVRIAGFLVIAPPFANRQVPGPVKVALALGIGLAVAPHLAAPTADTTMAFIGAVVLQAVVGLALGFGVMIVFAAASQAGALLDLFGGFQMTAALDPMNQTNGAVMERFYQFAALALLFASNGYQLVIRGLVRTFDAVPLDAGLDASRLAAQLTGALTGMFVGALQIAGPLILVLFCTDVGLGLLTRVAPALQAFALGFPLKILITLVFVGFAVLALPDVLSGLADDAVSFMGRAVGAG